MRYAFSDNFDDFLTRQNVEFLSENELKTRLGLERMLKTEYFIRK